MSVMAASMLALERKLLRIDARAQQDALQRIDADETLRGGLEAVIRRFLEGYHLASNTTDCAQLIQCIDEAVPREVHGFAYEGAAMYLAIADELARWRQPRLPKLMSAARPHDYIMCIGAGFSLARVPWLRAAPNAYAARFGPAYAGLVLDGFGFHEGFFATDRAVTAQQRPIALDGVAARCFDTGVGRALWFVRGASPDDIAETIAAFPPIRQRDLWAGVGLACAYAGSTYADLHRYASALRALAGSAGPHRCQLGLGVVFAAETRRKAGNLSRWTSHACEVLLDMPAEEAASLGLRHWNTAILQQRDLLTADAFLQAHRIASDRVAAQLTRAAKATC
jgi:hypothetical protein